MPIVTYGVTRDHRRAAEDAPVFGMSGSVTSAAALAVAFASVVAIAKFPQPVYTPAPPLETQSARYNVVRFEEPKAEPLSAIDFRSAREETGPERPAASPDPVPTAKVARKAGGPAPDTAGVRSPPSEKAAVLELTAAQEVAPLTAGPQESEPSVDADASRVEESNLAGPVSSDPPEDLSDGRGTFAANTRAHGEAWNPGRQPAEDTQIVRIDYSQTLAVNGVRTGISEHTATLVANRGAKSADEPQPKHATVASGSPAKSGEPGAATALAENDGNVNSPMASGPTFAAKPIDTFAKGEGKAIDPVANRESLELGPQGDVELAGDHVEAVKLGALLDAVQDKMDASQFERLKSSSHVDSFVTAEKLAEKGLAVEFDANGLQISHLD